MLVRQITKDARTGEVTEQWVDDPTALSVEQGQVLTQEAARQEANGVTLRDQAEQAIANLRTYRDLASPTNAQTIAAVKLLCRVAIGLIRLQLRKFDAAD